MDKLPYSVPTANLKAVADNIETLKKAGFWASTASSTVSLVSGLVGIGLLNIASAWLGDVGWYIAFTVAVLAAFKVAHMIDFKGIIPIGDLFTKDVVMLASGRYEFTGVHIANAALRGILFLSFFALSAFTSYLGGTLTGSVYTSSVGVEQYKPTRFDDSQFRSDSARIESAYLQAAAIAGVPAKRARGFLSGKYLDLKSPEIDGLLKARAMGMANAQKLRDAAYQVWQEQESANLKAFNKTKDDKDRLTANKQHSTNLIVLLFGILPMVLGFCTQLMEAIQWVSTNIAKADKEDNIRSMGAGSSYQSNPYNMGQQQQYGGGVGSPFGGK